MRLLLGVPDPELKVKRRSRDEGWTTSGEERGDENMREGEASKGRWPPRR